MHMQSWHMSVFWTSLQIVTLENFAKFIEWGWLWDGKVAVVAYFIPLSWYFPEETEKLWSTYNCPFTFRLLFYFYWSARLVTSRAKVSGRTWENHRVNVVAYGGWNRWVINGILSYFSEIFNVIISTAREDTYTLFCFWRPTNLGSLQAPLDHSFQNPPSSFNQNEVKNVGGEAS
jgi:hypothetical protein